MYEFTTVQLETGSLLGGLNNFNNKKYNIYLIYLQLTSNNNYTLSNFFLTNICLILITNIIYIYIIYIYIIHTCV